MLKLVIVEDEDIIREGLTACVNWRQLGYELAGKAANGKEGLQLVKETEPDVVLTDIRMPVMNGLQMIENIQKQQRMPKIIIVSGYEDFEYARNALRLGVSEYILKPLNLTQLREILIRLREEILKERRHTDEYVRLKNHESYTRKLIQKERIRAILLGEEEIRQDEVQGFFWDCYFQAAVCNSSSFSLTEGTYDYLQLLELDKEFEADFLQAIGGRENFLCVKTGMGERRFCIWEESEERIEAEKKSLEDAFSQIEGETLFLYWGPALLGEEGLNASCHQAAEVWNENCVKALEQITEVEGQESMLAYMNYDTSCLFEEIRTGTRETIEKELENFEKELARQKIQSHMHMLLLASNLYEKLMHLLQERNSSAGEVFGDPVKYYRDLITNTDRGELMQSLKEICWILHDYFQERTQGKFENVLKRALSFIRKEYANPNLQIKDVAKASYVSNSYLSIIMKKELGKTFVEYLTDIRMEQARKLLGETELRSYEVAQACGFSNPTYFSTVFKSVCGMSPSAYRKSIKEKGRLQ